MIIQKNGIWCPEKDTRCYRASTTQVVEVDKFIMPFVQQRRVCVQAGGNFGIWPKKFATLFEKVYTFEPENLNYECLKKNTENISNIISRKAALGSTNSTGRVVVVDEYNAGAHYVETTDTQGDVDIVAIDSLNLSDVDLLQYDIEGGEYNAILGSIDTIKRCNPVIVLEIKKLLLRYGNNPTSLFRLMFDRLGYCAVKTDGYDWVFIKR